MPDGPSAELRAALDSAPDDERALLEVRLVWTGLDEASERIAARLRVFIVTWDPLEWHDPRPARATATGDRDGFEVVLYVALDEILSETGSRKDPVALAACGLVDEAVAVGDAYAALDATEGETLARDVAVILAESGRADEAREVAHEARRVERSAFAESRVVVAKVGRNDPCPCGGG